MSSKTPLYVVQHNHFDPIWRRCWDRPFDYLGKRYRSYAELEEYFFDIWLENCERGALLSEGQAVVFRKYLERNPDRLDDIKRFISDGRIELTAAGETVPDTNMPSGETLLRNLVMGQLWFEDTFGVTPTIGWLEDAFGQSAQIPQIYRGCECTSVQKLSYKRVPGEYWRGLDGSVIFTAEAETGNWCGGGIKIAPCPQCNGYGCEACLHRGLADTSHVTDEEIIRTFENQNLGKEYAMFFIGGEEAVPNPRLPEIVAEMRQKYGGHIQYGGFSKIAEYAAEKIARIDDPSLEVSDQVEANPVSTGCYVSRIEIKKAFRRLENLLNTTERWATIAYTMGNDYPAEILKHAWQDLLFVAFHDAITSTHIDSAYFELLDMMDQAEHAAEHVMSESMDLIEENIQADTANSALVIYNSESWARRDPVSISVAGCIGVPVMKGPGGEELVVLEAETEGNEVTVTFLPPEVPALGYTVVDVDFDTRPADMGVDVYGPGTVETSHYRVTVSDKGITSIFDKRSNTELVDASKYLFGELVLEEDIGHPWGTMQAPSWEEGLSKYTTAVKIRRAGPAHTVQILGTYKGEDENTKILSWRQNFKFYEGLDRIDLGIAVDWDTVQRRIRMAVPTNIRTSEATYSIPYGALKRGPYEPDMSQFPSTNGDWPAINWVDVYSEAENRGIALINTGTPSHKVAEGVLFVSLLRSPTDSWCLNEPEFYDCPDFDGARDTGFHDFAFSVLPHAGDHAEAELEKRGRERNNPMMARLMEYASGGPLPQSHSFVTVTGSDNVIVTALKKSDRDDSVVVRLAEVAGKTGSLRVSMEDAGEKQETVNFLERNAEPLKGSLEFSPWKIKTLKIYE